MRAASRPVFCLIVEADPTSGLDLADAVDRIGWYVAGPFARGREALSWLGRFTPDVAVIGRDLADGSGAELVRELLARGVPVATRVRPAGLERPEPASRPVAPRLPRRMAPALARLMRASTLELVDGAL
jgi:hypothetical protein